MMRWLVHGWLVGWFMIMVGMVGYVAELADMVVNEFKSYLLVHSAPPIQVPSFS